MLSYCLKLKTNGLAYHGKLEISASKIGVKITVHGKGDAGAEIFRHLSPITIGVLMRNLPLHGRVNKMGESVVCIITQISTGAEKSRTRFTRGDIAFLPLNGSICIFLKESISTRPMNPIGRISSSIDILDKTGNGDTATLTLI